MEDMVTFARAKLEGQVRQLERLKGFLSPEWLNQAAYDPDETVKAFLSGLPSFRSALNCGRIGLQSDDPQHVVLAALECSSLIIDGLAKATRWEALTRRVKGGKTQGAKLAAEGNKAWAKYEKQFKELADGRDRPGKLTARRSVKAQMARDGFTDPRTGSFPTDKTIATHFPAK